MQNAKCKIVVASLLALHVSLQAAAYSPGDGYFKRGDFAYICYSTNSGWMWRKENRACPVRILDVTNNEFLVQPRSWCWDYKESQQYWIGYLYTECADTDYSNS